jgi:hypothetical protein
VGLACSPSSSLSLSSAPREKNDFPPVGAIGFGAAALSLEACTGGGGGGAAAAAFGCLPLFFFFGLTF